MKKAENFRLDDATRAKLSRIADLWQCSKTAVIGQLIMDFDEAPTGPAVPVDPEWQQAVLDSSRPYVNPKPDPKDPLGVLTDEERAAEPMTVDPPPVRQTKPHVHRQSIKKPEWKK